MLFNCVPVLSYKWLLIGKMLELSDSRMERIASTHKHLMHDEYRYQCACCAAMLTEWLDNYSDHDVTIDQFIGILEHPSVGLSSDEINKLRAIMSCGSKLAIVESSHLCLSNIKPPKAPTEHESKFTKMNFNVLKLLHKSGKDFSDTVTECL